MRVPELTIAFVILNMILGVAIPVSLSLFFKKKYGCSYRSFWAGCGVMLLFALVLEQMVHALVLATPAGSAIRGNLWLYALYGGIMAGLFEETGRLLAMKFLLKKDHANHANALMYGAGHGGFEAFMILTVTMLNNLIYAVALNAGQADALMAPLDEANRQVLQSSFEALANTSPAVFLLSPVERLAAVTGHIAMSILVWQAATRPGKLWCYFAAIGVHFFLDASAVILQGLGVPILAIEAVIWAIALAAAVFAGKTAAEKE